MKLLIITQKINKNDPILGFFHGWIKEFAKHFESIIGICLEKGEYDLPANVKVLSLGKEIGQSRVKYILNFYKYIWRERNNYDAVFVHMNQEYVLLGAKLWFLMGKKVFMWRNHHVGSFLTDVAAFFCTKVFCTSKYSYTAKYKKTVLMPVGIDTDLFEQNPEIKRLSRSILFLGRIAPIKKPDLLINALIELKKQNVQFTASFYGDPLSVDQTYFESLKQRVNGNNLSQQVVFHGGIPNKKTVEVYNQHKIFANLSTSGMYDKTIFEAMACGCLVLASNKNLNGLIDNKFIFEEGNLEELIVKINVLLNYNLERAKENSSIFRDVVVKNHSLKSLADKLFSSISS